MAHEIESATDPAISDADLEALALAADPTEHLSPDATPLEGSVPPADGPLPAWYMPVVASHARLDGRRRTVAVVVVASFLLINALGLCATYGFLTIG